MSQDTFLKLVEDQFLYGGKKYAKDGEKEVTDQLVDDYGINWLLGTIDKYGYRFGNVNREKDLLKTACYMYIIWLKFGYHLAPAGTAHDNYTTVELKSKYFSVFVNELKAISLNDELSGLSASDLLKETNRLLLSLRTRANINRLVFIKIYKLVERAWFLEEFDKIEEHDKDTWNEDKKVKEHGKA